MFAQLSWSPAPQSLLPSVHLVGKKWFDSCAEGRDWCQKGWSSIPADPYLWRQWTRKCAFVWSWGDAFGRKAKEFLLAHGRGEGEEIQLLSNMLCFMTLLFIQTCDLQTQRACEDNPWIINDCFFLYSLRDFLVVLCALIALTSPTQKFRRASWKIRGKK